MRHLPKCSVYVSRPNKMYFTTPVAFLGAGGWISARSVLLDGAAVLRASVVAAGSLVRGELLAYSICRGTPAVPVDERQ